MSGLTELLARVEAAPVPMRIRIRWEHSQWWAYFNGWPKSYFHSERLDWMCTAIAKTFPKDATAAADYDGISRTPATGGKP